MTHKENRNPWLIAIMCTILMIILGSVYAWSFFQKIVVNSYGWSNSNTVWIFSTAIAFLGFAAAWGGINLKKFGARKLAITGIILYGCGYLIGAFAFSIASIILLIIGFGIIGGTGLGLAYVTPVVSAAKWFPHKKGLITGMVVMGFGFGALLMSKCIAPLAMSLTQQSLPHAFLLIGIFILMVGSSAALFVKEPGEEINTTSMAIDTRDVIKQDILSRRFIAMWLIFFVNITAGIMFIGFQSPLLQEYMHVYAPELDAASLAAAGATLIAISSVFNGLGRFFWGSLSDKIGRLRAFQLILGSQTICFIALAFVHNPYLFSALVCYVLLCYGGGFGTMPSFVADTFSSQKMQIVYGMILTAWSAGGIAGSQLLAVLKDSFPANASVYAFITGAGLLFCGFVISMLVKQSRR